MEFNLFKRRDKGDKRGSEVLASLTSGGGTHLDAKDKEYAAQVEEICDFSYIVPSRQHPTTGYLQGGRL